MNASYNSGGKILRDFISKIEITICENNAKLIGEPINITFNTTYATHNGSMYNNSYNRTNNVTTSNNYGGRFEEFQRSGKYIISTFGKDIERYFRLRFPNLKITFGENSTTITDYLNRERILEFFLVRK